MADGLLTAEVMKYAHAARVAHGHLYLFQLEDSAANEVTVLARPLTHAEFDSLSQSAQLGDVTELVVETALIWPRAENWLDNPVMNLKAGDFEELATAIIDISGFHSTEGIVEGLAYARHNAGTLFNVAQAFICKAMPSLTPQELESLPWLTITKLLAQAEQLLQVPFPIEEFLKPQKEQKKGVRDDGAFVPSDFSQLPTFSEDQLKLARMEAKGLYEQRKTADNRQRQAALKQAKYEEKRRLAMQRRGVSTEVESSGEFEG